MGKIKSPGYGNKKMWEAGRPKEKQQYQCKRCRKKFITELNYGEESKRKAIQIFYKGNSRRSVRRLIKISKSMVYNWINTLSDKIEKSKPKDKISKEVTEIVGFVLLMIKMKIGYKI